MLYVFIVFIKWYYKWDYWYYRGYFCGEIFCRWYIRKCGGGGSRYRGMSKCGGDSGSRGV